MQLSGVEATANTKIYNVTEEAEDDNLKAPTDVSYLTLDLQYVKRFPLWADNPQNVTHHPKTCEGCISANTF